MRQLSILHGCAFFLLLPAASSLAQTKDEVFEGLIDTEQAGYASVENYLLKTETMGMSTVEYYEKTSSFEMNGKTYYVMSNVPLDEMSERQSADSPMSQASPEQLREAAETIKWAGEQAQGEFERELQESGVGSLGGGMLGTMIANPPPGKPWLSANPRDTTSMYATMLNAAADRKEQRAGEDPEADTRAGVDATQRFMDATVLLDERRTIDGRPALGLFANNLNYTDGSDGSEVTINSVTMWVDAERYVPLRLVMEGDMRAEGETRPISIERDDMDYQSPAGCGELYKPMRSVMRIGGMMTPEQQAQMKEAQAQMAQFEQQMAQMPEGQRAMIMRQMGPQMEAMKKMVSGGGFEVENKVTEMRCNTGVPGAMELAMTTFGGAVTGAAGNTAGPPNVVQIIQQHLQTLGYDPGNTSGELTKQTVVAITQYEAANSMPVTGEATPQLAGILSAAVDAL
ncbi:MAG: peptidoglycan-binding domain-containing protein [Woeseiaceae bacterium]